MENLEFYERQKRLKEIRKILNSKSVFNIFFQKKRYKEFFWGKEATWSTIFSVILLIAFIILYMWSPSKFSVIIPNILIALIGGYITLIGLSLSAFALVVSSFNKNSFLKLIKFSEDDGNLLEFSKDLINNFITIIYRFYLSATYNVIALLLFCLIYVYISMPINFCDTLNFIFGAIVIYYIVFCLLFTLTLFDSCIKLMFYY